VTKACSFIGYSRQAFYGSKKKVTRQAVHHEGLLEKVHTIRHSNPRMGGRKLLNLVGDVNMVPDVKCSRDRFFELLRNNGLLVKKRRRPYPVTTKSFGWFRKYDDHFNGMSFNKPHEAWVSDITYIRVADRFMYLFLTTDACSRKIIGWQLSDNMESQWAVKTLKMCMKQCPSMKGVIHHSDHGFQYCSKVFTGLLESKGGVMSMGKVGYCYDNAIAERVNGILKSEYLLDETFKNGDHAYKATREAIKSYNEERPHWSLGLKIPAEKHKAA
jgi:putative transposase